MFIKIKNIFVDNSEPAWGKTHLTTHELFKFSTTSDQRQAYLNSSTTLQEIISGQPSRLLERVKLARLIRQGAVFDMESFFYSKEK